MKFLIPLLFFILSFVHNIFAEDFKIDLIQKCNVYDCSPRDWWIIDSQDQSFILDEKTPNTDWININSFPIRTEKYYTNFSQLGKYTLVTFFDLNTNILSIKKQFGISLGEIGEVFAIYINGHLIHKEGLEDGSKVVYHRTVRDVVYEVPNEFLKPSKNRLVIQVSGHPKFDHTGLYLTRGYEIGLFHELKYKNQNRTTLSLIAIYIVVGIYHIFLFLQRKEDRYNLFFGLYATLLGIYLSTRVNEVFEIDIDTSYIQRLELFVLYPLSVTACLFPESLFFGKTSKKVLYYLYFNLSLSLITLLVPMYIAEYILRLWQLSTFVYLMPIALYIYGNAIKNNLPHSIPLLAGISLSIFSGIYDILDSRFLNTGLSFTKYTFLIYIVGVATILANKFHSMYNKVEELNLNLENKVQDRTKEVVEKMKRIEELMVQQNGDYFLTSLIEKPLITNYNKSKLVKTDFVIEQKKKFEFRNRKSQLGGDTCITGSLRFQGEDAKYVFFFNGDAMGKSMQGAGGAIVAGSVVNNILSRSAKNDKVISIPPKQWLEEAYMELDNVFRTFNGCMLISAVVGIINEKTLQMYHINAEHPYMVLYRNGNASFVDNTDLYIPKLGVNIPDLGFEIQESKLEYGDILICGSDGRDDIELGFDSNGRRELNNDPNLFLRIVEESKADLYEILDAIKSKGKITDDISLLKIEFPKEPT